MAAGQAAHAQTGTRYLVKFKNKSTNPFSLSNPAAFLSQRSIDRRTRYGIALDSTDLPVTPRYLDSIRSVPNVTILNVSKWHNQVSIQTTDATAIARINSFTFVQAASPIAARLIGTDESDGHNKFDQEESIQSPQGTTGITADYYSYGQSAAQVNIHNGAFLHNIGLRGQNMIISMLDAGYQNYLTVKAFDSARTNGQILGTWDFVARHASVNEDHSHGMQCFSTIAANIPGQFVGTAPKASFYLFRTEDAASEYPIEEHNWVCGAERADSAGSDIISSSLGYNQFSNAAYNHTYADMNGNTTIAAIGADLAAKKGILVVQSAGNEGDKAWKYIMTPADADSILTVGAVNASGVVAGFSSFGPTSDGQVKPDVASVGWGTTLQYPNNAIAGGNGTSFSAPNMAGLATCLWQGFPEFNNMKIIEALRQAGSIYATPNDRIGFGIPDVRKAAMNLIRELATATATTNNCEASISWTSKDMSSMKYEIERKAPGESEFTKVGEQYGTGAAFASHSYQFTDPLNNTRPGELTYRIRQIIDTSGASPVGEYISTVTLNLNATCTNDFVIAPNPVVRQQPFNILVTTQAPVQDLRIQIVNSLGQVVYTRSQSKPMGTITVPVPAHQWAKGKYYISVYTNGKLMSTKEMLNL